jgi:hypothetical protein
MLDIVLNKNIRLSDFNASDILGKDHLPIIFHVLDHVRARDTLKRVQKFTDWTHFQRLAAELTSPRIQTNSDVEVDKAALEFTASTADKLTHSLFWV